VGSVETDEILASTQKCGLMSLTHASYIKLIYESERPENLLEHSLLGRGELEIDLLHDQCVQLQHVAIAAARLSSRRSRRLC
jgi:hypothetical protein